MISSVYTRRHTHTHSKHHAFYAFYAFYARWFTGDLQQCIRYAMAPTRMSGHNCLPGPQTVFYPEGNRMNKTRGSTGRWQCGNLHNQNTPRLLHTYMIKLTSMHMCTYTYKILSVRAHNSFVPGTFQKLHVLCVLCVLCVVDSRKHVHTHISDRIFQIFPSFHTHTHTHTHTYSKDCSLAQRSVATC
jgi:hypothetical protein